MSEIPRMTIGGRVLHVATILTGSFLLFLVQPMVARMALPLLGGAPAVWNSAMLVYQALLLGGYAYAHMLGRMSPRGQAAIHLGLLLLACLWLPIGLRGGALPAKAEPVLWVPWLLGLSIGPLFLAVSAQAPLIQRWFNLSSGGRDPYALYAASNLGSFGGLIAYPILVEPLMSLRMQSLIWSAAYVSLLLMVAACALFLPARAAVAEVAPASPPPGRRRVAHWILLAFVPSGLMLATSTYITTDIVAMPLLWVIPLGLYLLSFSVAFAKRRGPADTLTRVAPITILLFGGVMMGGHSERPFFGLVIALILLFIASVALHTALYRVRPDPGRLTGFYLAMAFGGALGGVFAGLVAPVVFDWTYEFPLLILAAGLLVPQAYLTGGLRRVWTGSTTGGYVAFVMLVFALAILFILRFHGPGAMFGEDRQSFAVLVIAALGVATLGARLPYAVLLASALLLFGGYRAIALSLDGQARQRSYFGIYTVRDSDRSRALAHGTTLHGVQLLGSKARERTPTTYYAPGSGVGQAMTLAPALYGPRARIGVVGLGAGTLACYARPGERFRFYEIDPVIARIARTRFSYLADCAPDADIRIGDARLSLAAEPAASLDLLALDAFSADAVPMHLMTREAFTTYARILAPRGLLLVHISNRYLDLEPVVAAAARTGGWRGARFHYRPSLLDQAAMPSASVWLALARDPVVLARLEARAGGWKALRLRPGFAGWTDDYSTILPLIDLSGGR